MPELLSRMDSLNWLTPAIADILDQGSTPPGGDGSIRDRMLKIQHELEELETPARIVNARPTPSYTLYVARPGNIGRMHNRRAVKANEIKQSLKQIAENHPDWLLGYMPQLRQEDTAVGILLRTDEHRPISLRRLLVRSPFRKHPSTLAFVLGITLEQQLVVDSIDSIGHMLVVGNDNAKQHFIRSTLLTLVTLNTPSELRVAITGESSEAYKYIVGAPHALGRILTKPSDGQRLMDGLVKEIQRRKQSIQDEGVKNIEEYNKQVAPQGKTTLPRIILILDSLSDESWQTQKENWIPTLTTLLEDGLSVGIHLVITVNDEDNLDLPTTSRKNINLKVITRAASKDLSSQIPDFHLSLLRFIDAFVINNQQPDNIVPVELCAVSNAEIKNVVEYWRQTSKQRYQDIQKTKTSKQTGVTGVLTPPPELDNYEVAPPTPPKPKKPSVATLARATQKLGKELSTIALSTSIIEEQQEKEYIQQETLVHNQVEPQPIISADIDASKEIRDDEHAVTQTAPVISEVEEITIKFEQAVALTAYLGWISKGVLCDVFCIPSQSADQIIQELKEKQIIEDANYPTLRFIPLTQNLGLNGKHPQD